MRKKLLALSILLVVALCCGVFAACGAPAVSSVRLNKSTMQLTVEETETLIATVIPSDAGNKDVTWQSSDNSVATVSNSGKVTAISVGDAIITVKTVDGNKTATCAVRVNPKPVPVQSVSVNSKLSLVVGTTGALTVNVLPENATNKTVTYQSKNESVATVDDFGLVTAVGVGETEITVTSVNGNKTATCQIIVTHNVINIVSITLNRDAMTIEIGSKGSLLPIIKPENATNQELRWQSSNPEVATVTQTGLVEAVGDGQATITVITADGGLTATCVVTVAIPVSSVKLDKTQLTLNVNKSEKLTATVLPANADNKEIVWSSSNSHIASVDVNGNVFAKERGEAVITVTTVDGEFTAKCAITVIQPVTSVTLNETYSIILGQSKTLTYQVLPLNANNQNVTWSSDNEQVVTVNENGEITARQIGTANITVTTEDGEFTATCLVTVNPIDVTGITINKRDITLARGEAETLVASVTPNNASNKNIIWESSNPNVATVSQTGEVTAHQKGSSIIYARAEDGNFTISCTVNVYAAVESVLLEERTTLALNGEKTLVPVILPTDADNKAVTWSSTNAGVATVDQTGKVTAHSLGRTTITVKTVDGEKTASCIVDVIVPVESVTLGVQSVTLNKGEKYKLENLVINILPLNATNKNLVWESSIPESVKIENGEIIALGKCSSATVTVRAEENGAIFDTCEIIVEVRVTGVTLNKDRLELSVIGGVNPTETLIATINPTDANEQGVTWHSTNPTVASVTSDGVVTAHENGSATIIVTTAEGNFTAECEVSVVVPVESVSLGYSQITLKIGETFALADLGLTVNPTNAGNKNVTWESLNNSIATVDQVAGLITAHSAGDATIVVTTESGNKTATLTVKIPKPVSNVEIVDGVIALDTITLEIGSTHEFEYKINPDDAEDKSVMWSVMDIEGTNVLTISGSTVTANAIGRAKVIVTSNYNNGIYDECEVIVKRSVTSITITPDEKTLGVGESITLSATILPSNATATVNDIVWSSTNNSIVSVAQDGTITAIRTSGATPVIITARVDGKEDICLVTVVKHVEGVTLNKTEIELDEGAQFNLVASVAPSDATNKNVRWESSNENFVKVSSTGVITAQNNGTGSALITVITEDGSFSADCLVKVKRPVQTVSINSSIELKVGEGLKLTPSIYPETATYKTVTWSSSDESVARVDNEGNVQAIKKGSAKITATADGKSATCDVLVIVSVSSVELNVSHLDFVLDETAPITITATVNPQTANNKTVGVEVTGDGNVITVVKGDVDDVNATTKFIVTAIGKGSATIKIYSAENDAVYDTCTVFVKKAVNTLTLTPTAVELKVGETKKITSAIDPIDATEQTITWVSEGNNLVGVSQDGTITAKGRCENLTVSATVDGVTATCKVTVIQQVTGLTLDKQTLSFISKESAPQTITATVAPANANNKNVKWQSSNEDVATVVNGVVTPVGSGTTIITATTEDGGFSKQCTVSVNVPVTNLTIVGERNVVLEHGSTANLSVLITPENATNKNIVWTSNNEDVVKVNNGAIIGEGIGSTVVRATAEDTSIGTYYVEWNITVKVHVQQLTLETTTLKLNKTETYNLADLGLKFNPTNATNQQVSWSVTSNDGNNIIQIVDNQIVANNGGTATLTVKSLDDETKTASCVVTVNVPLTSVDLTVKTLTLEKDDTYSVKDLGLTILPSDASNKNVSWSSEDTGVITIANGVITAKDVGETYVVVTTIDGSKTAKCKIIVNLPTVYVESVVLSKTEISIGVDGSDTLTATVSPSDATNKTVTWDIISGEENITYVEGVVTGVKEGTAVIRFTSEDGAKTADCNVTITAKIIDVTSVELNKSSTVEIRVGDELQLNATVNPTDASNKKVSWSSSVEEYASVSQTGLVKGLSVGTTTITVTTEDGGKTATVDIKVIPAFVKVTSVSINDKASLPTQLIKDDTKILAATVAPSDATDSGLNWHSSDDSVATVDASGKVTAVGGGNVTITVNSVSNQSLSDSWTFDVVVPLEEISLNKSTLALEIVGQNRGSEQLTVTFNPSDATNKKINWNTDKDSVAMVNSLGNVVAVAKGTATITATAAEGNGTIFATCVVTVTERVTAVSLSPSTLTIKLGDTYSSFVASVTPSTASDANVIWTTQDIEGTDVLSITNKGVITATAVGSAKVIVTTADGGYTAECVVSVKDKVSGVSLNKTETEIILGNGETLTATIEPYGVEADSIVWASSNKDVVTVEEGRLTSVGVGYATVSITVDGFTAECNVEVYVPVQNVTITPDSVEVERGKSAAVTATVSPSNATHPEVIWSSSNESVATVENGVITAHTKGSTTITVEAKEGEGKFKDTVTVNVVVYVTGVELDESNITLSEGATKKLTATVLPLDANNQNVTWYSNNSDVVGVDNGGNLTAKAQGEATITVTTADGSKTAFCKVKVVKNVISVSLNKTETEIAVGDTEKLAYTINPLTADNKNVSWTSSDQTVATVSTDGTITPIKAGTTTITVTTEDGGKTAQCVVTVYVKVTGVTLDKEELTVAKGTSGKLYATIEPENATYTKLKWTSDNDGVVTVDEYGNLTPVAQGQATITVQTEDGKFEDTCLVTIILKVTNVTLDESDIKLAMGTTKTLTATVTPSDATNTHVLWSSNNERVATVDGNGKITPVSEGEATITVKTEDGNFTDTCLVTVYTAVESVTLNKEAITISIGGEPYALTATVNPENATDKSVTWNSSKPEVATVVDGVVTAVAKGKTTITVTTVDGDFIDTCEVTVVLDVADVTLNKNELTLNVDEFETLIATVTPDDATNKAVTWVSDNNSIATVDETGKVTAKAKGTATITVTAAEGNGTIFATCVVTVLVPVEKVELNKTTLTLNVGEFETLIKTITPANANNQNVTWSSNNNSVASVVDGKVTAKAKGTATITVTTEDGDFTAQCAVTVLLPVESVNIVKYSTTIAVGATERLAYTINPADASNLAVSWESSAKDIAVVDSLGTVTAKKAGSATITIKTADGNKTDTCLVTVVVPVTSVSIKSATSIVLGGTETLIASILPENATDKSVTWNSSKPEVATVVDGVVTAVAKGETIITVTTVDGAKPATCLVTVRVPVSGVTLNKAATTLAVGNNETLVATVLPSATPNDATNKKVTWTSDNPDVAEVDISTGKVIALSTGTATITATTEDGSKTDSCIVTVILKVTGVTLNKSATTIAFGKTEQLIATVKPDAATDKTVTWKSSDDTIATVSNDGTINPVKAGNVTITVQTNDGNHKAECQVTVVVLVSSVTLNKSATTIAFGKTEQLTATVAPSNATDKTLEWNSSNDEIATVSTDGTVTPIKAGTVTITATAKDGSGKFASCQVTVVVSVTGVTLNKSTAEIAMGTTEKLVATVAPENATNQNVTWKSDSEAIATVAKDGTITPVSLGTANITVTTADGNKTATCAVTVIRKATGVSLNKSATTIAVGTTEKLTATVTPDDTTNKEVTWKSSDDTIATVSTDGTINPIKAGTVTITATAKDGSGKFASCQVTVVVSVTGVTLSSTAITLKEDETATLTATVLPSNATNKNVSWLSDNPTVASVVDGVVTANAVGTANIIVTTADGSKTVTCAVTVNPVPVEGIELDKTSLTMNVGGPVVLYVTFTPTNATNKDLIWESSNTNVVTVISGVLTGIAPGTATITVTSEDGGFTKQCAVTVQQFTLNKVNIGLTTNGREQLLPAIVPVGDYAVTWSTANSNIATVDSNGMVTGKAVGTTTITAKISEFVLATCTVTVTQGPATAVTIDNASPVNLIINADGTKGGAKMTATPNGSYTNMTWSVDNTSVITIDSVTGVVTVQSAGAANVIVTVTTVNGTISASCAVKVTNTQIILPEIPA